MFLSWSSGIDDSAEICFSSFDHESKSFGKLESVITPALRACIRRRFGEAAHADQSAGAASAPTPFTFASVAQLVSAFDC